MTKLSVHGVSLTLDNKKILNDVTLSLKGGELVGLIGPNGAGKSSLLRAITGGQKGWSGNVLLDDRQIETFDRKARAKLIAYMPQRSESLWPISGRRLVMLGRLPHLGPLSRETDKDRKIVDDILREVDAIAFADRPVTHLSGGEMARIWLARALAVQAPILLADEPIAALDPAHQLATMSLFRQSAHNGKAVLTVLHDLGLAARMCDRLILIDQGRVVADGKPDQVLTPDRVAEVYNVRLDWDGNGHFKLQEL